MQCGEFWFDECSRGRVVRGMGPCVVWSPGGAVGE